MAFLISFSRVKVAACEKIFEVDVSIGVILFEFDHWVRLTEQRSRGSQLSQLDELQDDLFVEIDQSFLRQFQVLNGLQDDIPVTVMNFRHEACNETGVREYRSEFAHDELNRRTMGQNRRKHRIKSHLFIHYPTNKGVSEESE